MALGAIILGPPLAWAGYTFLRDAELEGYHGRESLVCGRWPAGWCTRCCGACICSSATSGSAPTSFAKGLEIWQMVVLVVPVVAMGTLAAYVAFDLDPGSAFFHWAMYFAVTVILRLVTGLRGDTGTGWRTDGGQLIETRRGRARDRTTSPSSPRWRSRRLAGADSAGRRRAAHAARAAADRYAGVSPAGADQPAGAGEPGLSGRESLAAGTFARRVSRWRSSISTGSRRTSDSPRRSRRTTRSDSWRPRCCTTSATGRSAIRSKICGCRTCRTTKCWRGGSSPRAKWPTALRDDWELEPADVADLVAGNVRTTSKRDCSRSMLSGPIDVDKIDYLMRDSLHAGVPYGRNFDRRRLIGSLCLNEAGDALAITDKGKTAAEMMVFARYVMFSEVYWHHAVRCGDGDAAAGRVSAARRGRFRATAGAHRAADDRATACRGRRAARRASCSTASSAPQRRLYKRLAQYSYFEEPEMYRRLARQPYAKLARVCRAARGDLEPRPEDATSRPHEMLVDAPPAELEVEFDVEVYFPEAERLPAAGRGVAGGADARPRAVRRLREAGASVRASAAGGSSSSSCPTWRSDWPKRRNADSRRV